MNEAPENGQELITRVLQGFKASKPELLVFYRGFKAAKLDLLDIYSV